MLDNHLLYGAISADVVISHARAGITCGDTFVCPVKDFVTGGGQLDVAGGRLSFGMVGGLKANGLSGHFNGVDHRSGGPHIRAHELSDYVLVDALTRRLDYVCDGTGNSLCRVTVTDAGEPGRADHFAIMSGGYAESGCFHGAICNCTSQVSVLPRMMAVAKAAEMVEGKARRNDDWHGSGNRRNRAIPQ